MSDADATDPVRALRGWCAECDGARQGILGDLHRVEGRIRAAGCGRYGDVVAKASAALSAAPALLARIEAGEGLLREARDDLFSLGMNCGHPMGGGADGAEARKIHARIDAFLAGKEAPRG